MHSFFIANPQIFWPLMILLTWFLGEIGAHLTKIPKITFYILAGFIFSIHQTGFIPEFNNSAISFLINIIAGLLLFALGYKINLNWVWNNSLILITSIIESSLTFTVVFIISRAFGISILSSLEFAALLMATSPFVVIYILNQQQSAGQVTERVLHLTALNCLFAIFTFKLVLGLMIFQKSGNLWQASLASFIMVAISTALGVVLAVFLALIMQRLKVIAKDRAVVLSLIIILIAGVTKTFNLSILIAALSFGLTARYMKIAMGQHQRNFGKLEEILIVVLFVIIPVNLDWHNFSSFIGLAVALFLGRLFTKVIVIALLSYYSGTSLYKGVLTGLAMTSVPVFAILLLDQSNAINLALNHELLVISGLILFLEIVGPCITKYALVKARETLIN